MKDEFYICLFLLVLSFASSLQAAEYHVSPTGNDQTGNGLENAPWKTISHAANVLKAGDTCFIHEGVYREAIAPKASGTPEDPIIYRAYQNDRVLITACDPLIGWEKIKGDIYAAPMDWSIRQGYGNTVFVEDQLAREGRWPNDRTLLNIKNFSRTQSAEAGKITDTKLPRFPSSLKGAVALVRVNHFRVQTHYVTGFSSSSRTLTLDASSSIPEDAPYFLSRHLDFVDQPGEWFYDRNAKRLFLQFPPQSDPNDLIVESRRREFTANFSDKNHIHITGITFRAGEVITQRATGLKFTSCEFQGIGRNFGPDRSITTQLKGTGLAGQKHHVTQCIFRDAFGHGLAVHGRWQTVTNNQFMRCGLDYGTQHGISIQGYQHQVSYNTIENVGRAGIYMHTWGTEVGYNDISRCCRLTNDCGGIYLVSAHYRNSRIHHNHIHNIRGPYSCGIYCDGHVEDLIIDHNYAHDVTFSSGKLNTPASFVQWHFNTLIDDKGFDTWAPPSAPRVADGVVLTNNVISRWRMPLPQNVLKAGNRLGGKLSPDKQFSDIPESSTPLPYAEIAVQLGRKKIGNAYEPGAFEAGVPAWKAGHTVTPQEDHASGLVHTSFSNLIDDSSFEHKFRKTWKFSGITLDTINDDSWNHRDQAFTLLNKNAGRISARRKKPIFETSVKLKPNTRYQLKYFCRTGGRVFPGSRGYGKWRYLDVTGKRKLKPKANMFNGETPYLQKGDVAMELHIPAVSKRNKVSQLSEKITRLRFSYLTKKDTAAEVFVVNKDQSETKIGEILFPAASRLNLAEGHFPDLKPKSKVIIRAKDRIDHIERFYWLPEEGTTLDIKTILTFKESKREVEKTQKVPTSWQNDPFKVEFTTGPNETAATLRFLGGTHSLSGYLDGVSISEVVSQ